MGLRDELEIGKPPNKCTVHMTMQKLDAETVAELQDILDDPIIPATAISKLAESKGWAMRAPAITRHRRKECQCH